MIANSIIFNNIKNNNLEIKTGHIVGYNIKKCYALDTSVIGDMNYKLIYGLFVHIKLDNNDQYDMVFDAFSSKHNGLSEIILPSFNNTSPCIKLSKTINWKDLKDLNKQAKRKNKVSKVFRKSGIYHTTIIDHPPILEIMHICNADELVDIIGKEVKLSTIIDDPNLNVGRLSFYLFNVNNNNNNINYTLIPLSVNINTSNESINRYIDYYSNIYPVMVLPEYDKFNKIIQK